MSTGESLAVSSSLWQRALLKRQRAWLSLVLCQAAGEGLARTDEGGGPLRHKNGDPASGSTGGRSRKSKIAAACVEAALPCRSSLYIVTFDGR